MDQVIADTDSDVLKMKEDIQNMWNTCQTKRGRRTIASEQVPGFTMVGDNVGKFILIHLYFGYSSVLTNPYPKML